MLTVDYDFYTDTFHGTLEEDDFIRLSVFAAAYLDELTLGRITEELSDTAKQLVSLALCAVCDARAMDERRDGIASETNDGISVSYITSGSAVGAASPGAMRLYNAAALYLAPTGLLYRGVSL